MHEEARSMQNFNQKTRREDSTWKAQACLQAEDEIKMDVK
jgi:hypothetical protein